MKNHQYKVILKMLTLSLVVVVILGLAVYSCFIITEKFFFTLLLEGKSQRYGYWPANREIDNAKFGKRITEIENLRYRRSKGKEEDVFEVAVLGDSFVWGQGVLFKNTVSQQLEKKLVKLYSKVNVVALASGGDSLLDQYAKVLVKEEIAPADVYVVVIVNNDLLLRQTDDYYPDNTYGQIVQKCIAENGIEPTRYLSYHQASDSDREVIAKERFMKSSLNATNICVFEESLEKIVEKINGRLIFFLATQTMYEDSTDWQTINFLLEKNNITVVRQNSGKSLVNYSHCWNSSEDFKKCFYVTPHDYHPSPLAHKLYSDLISKEVNRYLPLE